MDRTQEKIEFTAIIPGPDGGFVPCPSVMTEPELIMFLRIPEISNARNYRHVVENLKRTHGLPRISLLRTKGQVRATTLGETARSMKDFVECVGDIDVQEVRYEHGERFVQYCLDQGISAAMVTKKVKHLKRVFQLAEDRGQLDRHPLRRLKPPKVARRKIRVFTDYECSNLCRIARQYEEKGSPIK